jgi:cephalosporin hydroxylase
VSLAIARQHRAITEQILPELAALNGLLPDPCNHIVEIGVRFGGTLRYWHDLCPEADILGIDQAPELRWEPEPSRITLLQKDSHHPHTLDAVDQWLDGWKLDLLHIDGDHTPNGVKADYDMYSPLVRPGGIIVFHDVGVSDQLGWRPWWDDLALREHSLEIRANGPGTHPDCRFGIGVIFKGGWDG